MTAVEAAQIFHSWAQHEGMMPGDVATAAAWEPAWETEIDPVTDAGKAALRQRLVLTVGHNERENAIVVFTKSALPQSRRVRATLPETVGGYSVTYRQGVQSPIGIAAPATPFGGPAYVVRASAGGHHLTCGSSISVGNNREAGTLGCLVRNAAGDLLGLSNNHVTGACNYAAAGLPIVAPGVYDVAPHGLDPFTLGYHLAAMPMVPGVADNVDPLLNHDAALFRIPEPGRVTSFQGAAYDTPDQVIDPAGGMTVEKVGRTTGHTHGTVLCQALGPMPIGYNIPLYSFSGQVYFDPMFVVVGQGSAFSESGDSGSLVTTVTPDGIRHAVGLVVGGMADKNAPGGNLSLILPLRPVIERMNLTLVSRHNL